MIYLVIGLALLGASLCNIDPKWQGRFFWWSIPMGWMAIYSTGGLGIL